MFSRSFLFTNSKWSTAHDDEHIIAPIFRLKVNLEKMLKNVYKKIGEHISNFDSTCKTKRWKMILHNIGMELF